MSYLRKKLQAIMACADFKGYLREVTGAPPLTLADCMGSDLVSLSVTGNAVQDGTPSPDAPVEVQGVGEKTGNLFDINNLNLCMTSTSSIDYTPKVENGVFYSGGQLGKASGRFPYVEIGDAETVTISFTVSGEAPSGYIYGFDGVDDDGVVIGNVILNNFSNSLGTITFTYTGAKQYIGICAFSQNRYGVALSNIQVLEGSHTAETIPQYEPYGYKVPVKVGGINLFDVSQITGTSGGYVQEGEIYVIGYPYQTGFTPEKFLAMTGLKEGDTVTTAADYEQVYQPPNPTSPGAQWITFAKKPSAPADLSNVQFGIKGALKTTTIPEGFNSDNYNGMYIYGGSGTTETGQVRAIYRNLRVYKGTYTADTMPTYEPYHEPQMFNVYMDKPLYEMCIRDRCNSRNDL